MNKKLECSSEAMIGGYSLGYFGDSILMGRLGKLENIARAVLFLASDAAGHIAGFTLFVDGGMLLGHGWKHLE